MFEQHSAKYELNESTAETVETVETVLTEEMKDGSGCDIG